MMPMLYGAGVLGAVLVVTLVVLSCKLLRALRELDQMGDRLAHFADALTLLTETSEVGFRSTARELARLTDVRARRRNRKESTSREPRAAVQRESAAQTATGGRLAERAADLRARLDNLPLQPRSKGQSNRLQLQGGSVRGPGKRRTAVGEGASYR